MKVTYLKMTGEELRSIWTVSGLDATQFAKHLKISRSGLYILFGQNAVHDDVETRLDAHPELSKYRKMLKAKEEEPISYGTTEKLYKEVMDMCKNTIDLFNKSLMLHEREFDKVERDSDTLRAIVDQGVKSGAIRFDKPTVTTRKH